MRNLPLRRKKKPENVVFIEKSVNKYMETGVCVCTCVCTRVCVSVSVIAGGILKYVCVEWTNTKPSPVRESSCVRESMGSLFTGTVSH